MASTFQTLSNVYEDVRFLVSKDSTTLADSDLLRIANKYFGVVFREFVDTNEDYYTQISTTPLVAGQREYPLPSDSISTYGGGAIKLIRVEVSYNGTDWYVANPIDLNSIKPPLIEADITNYFSKSNPYFADYDRGIWLLPAPTTTDSVGVNNTNLKIFWVQRPNEMTASTDIPDMPKDFLNLLSEGMTVDVLKKLGRSNEARIAETNFYQKLQRAKQLEQHIDEPIIFRTQKQLSDYQ